MNRTLLFIVGGAMAAYFARDTIVRFLRPHDAFNPAVGEVIHAVDVKVATPYVIAGGAAAGWLAARFV